MDLVSTGGTTAHRAPVADPALLHVRELARHERDLVQDVFEGLSAHSRHLRFHTPVPALRPATLAYLSDVDGHRHVALVAQERGSGRPVGLARYHREGTDRAEVALEVVDAWQSRGVGRLLLGSLAQHARARGVQTLVAEVVGDNRAAVGLLRGVLTDVRTTASSGLVHVLASTEPREDVAACA